MSDGDDDDLIFDDDAFNALDKIEDNFVKHAILPARTTVNVPGLKQRDLFGGTVQPPSTQKQRGPVAGPSRVNGAGPKASTSQDVVKVAKVKHWDSASFAKHGWSKRNAAASKKRAKKGTKGKGKQRSEDAWDEDEDVLEEESDSEDEEKYYVDTTYDPSAAPLPIKWPPDPDASKTWVYPCSADKPMRTYQYNICSTALFANTLVSLPTGLGKTFIAAVVMLNFYRWYPHGKIIFMAPSRPLVAQQVIACHYIAGIPQEDCVELTGSTSPKLRALGWATKRVVYSTPQTVENDLRKGRLDPLDVVCVVVDEAHKASGDYAYCGVVRYMMSRNRHFRILALTATPGARGEAVQEVIDNLHICNVQVRTDQSLDIRQYIHNKSYDLRVLSLGEVLGSIRDRWAELMRIYLGPLNAAKLVWGKDPETLSTYAVQQAMGLISKMPGNKSANGKYYGMVKALAKMARAMEYLIVQSLSEFDTVVKDMQVDGPKALTAKPEFQRILSEVRDLRNRSGYVGHPKMERLRSMCLEHFKAAEQEIDPTTGQPRQTRVMVFCNYRAVVEEIVACLNTQRPLIKATPFVGQASSKNSRGMSQKEQIETIQKFKKGVYNVLVASSIGEEGLDIGEIDLIVCYEANKSPIRMLQRVGRTGRARDGHIIVLMTEGREETNWQKAKDQYTTVQNALVSNKIFELFVDGDRMLPNDLKPDVNKVEIKARPLNLSTMTMAGQHNIERKLLMEDKKRIKKQRDPKLNMPPDVFEGFRTAGQLAAAARQGSMVAPTQVVRSRRQYAYLSDEQEAYMRSRWLFFGDNPVVGTTFSTADLPFNYDNTGSAHVIPRRSHMHGDLLAVMKKMHQLDDAQPEALDAWHANMSEAFDQSLISIWDPANRSGPRPLHPDLRRPPPVVLPFSSSPVAPPSEDEAGRNSAIPGSSLPLAASSPLAAGDRHRKDSSRPSSPIAKILKQDLDELDTIVLSDDDIVLMDLPAQQQKPPVPRLSISRPASKAAPEPSAASADIFNVLSSDDEAAVPRKAGYQPIRPNPMPVKRMAVLPPSSELILPDENEGDVAFGITDSQLLRGAAVKGAKGSGVSALADTLQTPLGRNASKQTRGPSPQVVPDSDEEQVTRRSEGHEEDDFSFFDLGDDALADLMKVEQAVQKQDGDVAQPGAGTSPNVDDSMLMPPPPSVSTSKSKPASVYRARPRQHVVPSSDSSDAVGQYRQPIQHAASKAQTLSKDPPTQNGGRITKQAPMRKLVVDSSSPADNRPAPAPTSAKCVDSLSASSGVVTKALNRMRRGRRAPDEKQSSGDEAVDVPPKKRKRRKVTDKDVARNNMFDFEAINSEASGTEASSEAYASENSQDRAFVASEGDYDLSEGQAAFYRESLLTQAPGFMTRLGAFGGNGVNRRRSGHVNRGSPMTPITPNSQDQWSYDSFCVPDDAEIEMEASSDQI